MNLSSSNVQISVLLIMNKRILEMFAILNQLDKYGVNFYSDTSSILGISSFVGHQKNKVNIVK